MHGHCYTHESSEAKLLHSIYELTQRILHAEDRAYRDELRSVVQTLREQLIKLVRQAYGMVAKRGGSSPP